MQVITSNKSNMEYSSKILKIALPFSDCLMKKSKYRLFKLIIVSPFYFMLMVVMVVPMLVALALDEVNSWLDKYDKLNNLWKQ